MRYLRCQTTHWALRELRSGDEPQLVQYLNDPELYANTLFIPYPYTESDARDFLMLNRDLEAAHQTHFNWMITDHEDQVIGGIGLLYEHGITSHKSGFGYWLGAPFRSRGMMTEIVLTFCDLIFDQTGLTRLEAMVYTHNPASARVLEKSGFTLEGLMRHAVKKEGNYVDAWFYARLKEDAAPHFNG